MLDADVSGESVDEITLYQRILCFQRCFPFLLEDAGNAASTFVDMPTSHQFVHF